jgi:hypothetical protein
MSFIEGKIQVMTKNILSLKEIIKYNALSEADQLFASARKNKKNGLKNAMILVRRKNKNS